MTALVLAVFLASVLGSLHCVGMCGAFLALAFADAEGNTSNRWRLPLAYHGGRLATYTLLGAAAGALGSLLDLAGTLAGLQRVALPLAGLTVAGFGVVTLMRLHGVKVPGIQPPAALRRFVHTAQGVAMKLSPTKRALAIGLLTTMLPCGWLYAFAVTAAGTASPLLGGVVMAVFWAGTLPALVACGVGVQKLAGPLGRRLPTVTCALLIVLGLWTVTGRAQLDPTRLVAAATTSVQAPSEATVPAPGTAPCCQLSELEAKP